VIQYDNQRGFFMQIKQNQEIIGILHAITDNDISIKITFTYMKEIEIPASAFSIKKLQSIVGKNIGIINIDGQFFLREI